MIFLRHNVLYMRGRSGMTQSLDRYESFDFLHGSWTRRVL